jgi:beta,beta-carotene 9',10'-dioxygenase
MPDDRQLIASIETMAPFRRSREFPGAVPAQVEGNIPDWLRGKVVRTCPAVFTTPGWQAQHWFDGLCMLYALRIGPAGVDFRSRLLDSEAARDAWQGKSRLSTFGTPTARPLWQRIVEPVPRMTDNDNVNIVQLGDELVALTEGSRQLVIDETLAPLGTTHYTHDALGAALMTAHPQFDFARGKVVNVATAFGAHGTISVYEHAANARQRDVIGAWRPARIPYIHTFGLTPDNAILAAHPFAVTTTKMLFSNKGYIDHFDWRPEEGTRLVVIDRASGAVREHVTAPFFCFHTINAFERGDETVLDLLAYPDADIVAALRVARMAVRLPDLRPAPMRVVMREGVERAAIEPLGETGFEFPSINYRQASGRPYRYAYGAANGPHIGADYPSAIVKVDLERGGAASFSHPDFIFGEPLFVARPGAIDEDDGVLLAVGSRREGEMSMLAIIDAQTMTVAARASVPSAIPLGFHGSFVRQEGLQGAGLV